MTMILLKLICPVVLFISIFYPYYRGLKQVCWWKSILLGWGFFVLGCAFREYGTPLLAGWLMNDAAKEEVTCANSYMLYGIALGWFIPLVFHYLGVCTTNEFRRRRERRARKSNGSS